MNWNDQSKSFPIVVRRVRRKAQAFGTSALELMLFITFLIMFLLLAYYSRISDRLEASRQAAEAGGATSRPNPTPEMLEDLVRQRDSALAAKSRAEQQVGRLQGQLSETENANRRLEDQVAQLSPKPGHEDDDDDLGPPIIRLTEADGFSFETNSSLIGRGFEGRLLEQVVPRILAIAKAYRVDTIDIVGHTDERPAAGDSNLDERLLPYLNGQVGGMLTVSDNAGLGLARAAVVARILALEARIREGGYQVLPMSGAQVILTDGTIADGSDPGDVPDRRRIEIRMRRSDSRP